MTRTLLVAGGVATLDAARPVARALLVDGARVAWVGDEPADAPPHDASADLGSAWVLPAFVDAHVHATAAGLALSGVDCTDAASLADCLDRLRRHVAGEQLPGPLLGTGWDETCWPEPRPPTAGELSAAAPGRTVLLERVDAHSCVVDAETLARLPVDRLEGVARDGEGRPTGWLREQAAEAARRHVRAQIPEARLTAARRAAVARAAALGIASLHEMGHPGLSGLDDALAWAAGGWDVEVLVWWAELDPGSQEARRLRPGGDLFLDGSIGSRTAAVSRGYPDGSHGQLFHDDAAVARFFTQATADRRGGGVHAIGDLALAQALRGLESAAEAHGTPAVRACRHRIEHLELADRGHVARLAALGVVASVQPAFDATWGGAGGMYARRFGREVALASNPLRWLEESGVPLAFGSDAPVTPMGPWKAVHAAEHHHGGLGLDRAAAVAAHVLGGRHAAAQDDVGPLRPGARADLAMWDADPFDVDDVRRLCCLATIVAGRAVYGGLPLTG